MGSFPETVIDIRKNNNSNNIKEKTVKFFVQMREREKEVSLCKRFKILERF